VSRAYEDLNPALGVEIKEDATDGMCQIIGDVKSSKLANPEEKRRLGIRKCG
jgi:hypothetical protein